MNISVDNLILHFSIAKVFLILITSKSVVLSLKLINDVLYPAK